MGFLRPLAINTFVSFFNTSEPSLKLPMTGSCSFPYLLQWRTWWWWWWGWKLGRMIDVELASCITNSTLLGRQRKRETEREREGERMKSGLAYSWLKLKTVGSVCAGGFCPPPLLPPDCFPSPSPVPPYLPSAHSIFCREDGLGGSIKGLF